MTGTKVAIIGGGITGLIYAHVLRKNGFEPVVFEKNERVGGVWALAYPGVRLQNVDFHYHLSDVPWPSPPDQHPTRDQIRAYWEHVVTHLSLDVRLGHTVESAREVDGGWRLVVKTASGETEHRFDRLVVAVGQYTEGKLRPRFEGEDTFRGVIGSERDVRDFAALKGKRLVVVGFGKSALDVAALASANGAEVHHVFRTPRWVLPMEVLGLHSSWLIFNRFGSVMMPAWGHPTAIERFLHRRLAFGVQGFWRMLARVVRWQIMRECSRPGPRTGVPVEGTDGSGPAREPKNGRSAAGTGAEWRARLDSVLPTHALLPDLRSAVALAPPDYYRRVAHGEIQAHRAEITSFDETSVRLSNGETIACDQVVLALGSESPRFPFLAPELRRALEGEPDGVQLYRHLVHPTFPHVGFAGFNHGFLHVPAAEVGAQWMACAWRGELELPSTAEMEQSIERIRAWKRANIAFEPSRSCAINTRYQQHLDILLSDLGVSPYRKLPNVVGEVFARYGAEDYRGVYDELKRSKKRPLRPVPYDA